MHICSQDNWTSQHRPSSAFQMTSPWLPSKFTFFFIFRGNFFRLWMVWWLMLALCLPCKCLFFWSHNCAQAGLDHMAADLALDPARGGPDTSGPLFWVSASSDCCLPGLTVDGSTRLWPTTVRPVQHGVAATCAKSARTNTEQCPSSRGGSLPVDCSRERGKGVYAWRLFSITVVYSTFLPSHLLFLCLCCLRCCFCLLIVAFGSFIFSLIFFYCFDALTIYFIAWFFLFRWDMPADHKMEVY